MNDGVQIWANFCNKDGKVEVIFSYQQPLGAEDNCVHARIIDLAVLEPMLLAAFKGGVRVGSTAP